MWKKTNCDDRQMNRKQFRIDSTGVHTETKLKATLTQLSTMSKYRNITIIIIIAIMMVMMMIALLAEIYIVAALLDQLSQPSGAPCNSIQ